MTPVAFMAHATSAHRKPSKHRSACIGDVNSDIILGRPYYLTDYSRIDILRPASIFVGPQRPPPPRGAVWEPNPLFRVSRAKRGQLER